jgi:hypothetical protein
MLDDGRHVAQKTVQQDHVGRQIVEIEPHTRFYFCSSLRPSTFPSC